MTSIRLLSVLPSAVGGLVLAGGLLMGPGGAPGQASGHFDAPSTIFDPQLDSTDVYAFTSPERPDTVTLIANYIPLQGPLPLPHYQFAESTNYDIHVDPSGTAKPSVTYRWTFRDDTGLFRQRYQVQELRPGHPAKTLVAGGSVGPAAQGPLTPDYAKLRNAAISKADGGIRTFAGQAKDPFFIDTRILNEIGTGNPIFLAANFQQPFNVHTIAIQVPKKDLALRGDPVRNPVVGVWTTAARRTVNLAGGGDPYRQVSRAGNGLMTGATLTAGALADRLSPGSAVNRYNLRPADQDHNDAAFLDAIHDPAFPRRLNLTTLGLGKVPPVPRKDLEEIYLTGLTTARGGPIRKDLNSQLLNKDADPAKFVLSDQLRLNVTTPIGAQPHRYGLLAGDEQGFPNGRRLTDDASVIGLRILLGEPAGPAASKLLTFTPVSGPGKQIDDSFPYVALPNLR